MIYLILNYTGENAGPSTQLKNSIKQKIELANKNKWFYQSKDQLYYFNFSDNSLNKQNSEDINKILKNNLKSDFKIYLGMHGMYGETEKGFQIGFDKNDISEFSFQELALQFSELFKPIQNKKFKLSLVMCYGARSADYLLKHDFSQDFTTAQYLKSSFAFKFYNQLVNVNQFNQLIMTASTGAISYANGTREIEDEEILINYIKFGQKRSQNYELQNMIDVISTPDIPDEITENLVYDIFSANETDTFNFNSYNEKTKLFLEDAKIYWNSIRNYENPMFYRSKYNKIIFKFEAANKNIILYSKYDKKTLLVQKI